MYLNRVTYKALMLFTAMLMLAALLVACGATEPPPTEPPPTEPPVEAAPTELPAPEGETVDLTDLFPEYPTTLPAHCDADAVMAAYEQAKELWVNPIQNSSGWEPVIRPAEERYAIGYIQGLGGFPADSRMVNSVKIAADLMCVDVTLCDSKYEGEASVNCAQVMVDQGVDGVINSNWYAPSMDAMGEILADTPTVVNEVPMPGGTFFGVDNCQAGTRAGDWLIEYVKANYEGDMANIWVVNNENPDVGEVPMMRLGCMEEAIKAAFPEIPEDHYVRIPGGSFTDTSFEAMTTWLTAHPDAEMILTTNINDNGAVGAATACDTAGRTDNCAVVGHGGEAQAWNELDRPEEESALKASVDYVQNEYGLYLVPAIVDKVEGVDLPEELHNYIYTLDRSNMAEHAALRPED